MRLLRTFAVGLVTTGLAACAGENAGDEELGSAEQAVTSASDSIVSAVTSDPQDIGGFPFAFVEPTTVTVFDLHIVAKSKWQGVVTSNLSWDADKVRQGQTLDVSRSGSALGIMKVLWTVTGTVKPADGLFGTIDIGEIPMDLDVAGCSPPLDGSAFHCEATSPTITLFDGLLPTTIYVKFGIGVDFDGDGGPASVHRTLYLGDDAKPASDLELTADAQGDANAMPCDKPVGTTVDYALDPFKWSPSSITVKQQPKIIIGFHDPFLSIPIDAVDIPVGPAIVQHPDFTLEGPGNSVTLGDLQANNVLPTIAPLGPFAGQEGLPVSFSQSTTSACPITSYVWEFSDGTTSFGPHPQRTFGDDALFNGQLTVTDSTSLSATGSFDVSIGNRPPVANAGNDTGGAWGTAIALNGQAVDPGADDQATLVYTWDFGDGTPGAGGASVTHAYAVPGDYVATFKACDDHVCDTDTAVVHVRKRTTFVGYTGANAGTYSAPTTLIGSVVDELGLPVVGGTVAFTLGGISSGSAQTNASGNAARTIDVDLPAGPYAVAASYDGSAFYFAGNTAEQFDVSRMSSSLQYTGALGGGPNKTVSLSAKLVDGLNRPLAGQLVTFQLGTQSVSATTAATGIATASLKLAQKNASYPLTTTWPGNASQWTGAATSVTFSIGGK
ncbi:MAG TPA: PKD domain-containing protein [Kofleriaceae bacterium]|nr:PKD domain-containing protein [Kofleriaceae bacterium]